MTNKALLALSDIATEAHTRIQKDFRGIDPVIGITQNMRSNGIPADAMTIDCLKTGKRIILILHDEQPGMIRYQFSFKDQDPSTEFEVIESKELNATLLYQWIKGYFSPPG